MEPAPELVALLQRYYAASAHGDTHFLDQRIARQPGALVIGTDPDEWWRGGDLGKSMSSYLVERVQAADNVEVLYHTAIRRMLGDTVLEAVEIENTQTGERRTMSTPAVFSFVGAVPRTDWLPAEIEGVGEGSMAIAFIHQYLVYSHF